MKYVIGIDLGTSGVKCILLSDGGRIVSSRSASYSPDFGERGHVEQDPAVWWDNTLAVLKSLIDDNPGAADGIVAMSCSGQMHSSVFLDGNGNVVRPAILWNDTRTTKQTKTIRERAGGEGELLRAVYNRALEGFTLPKILWLAENEPDNFKKVAKVIMPKDYINYKLTGRVATDCSDAAGTLLFDIKNRAFDAGFAVKMGVPPEILPEVLESTGVVGTLSADIAREIGLPEDVSVVAGGADNSCAAIGNGVVKEGQAVLSIGTSGTIVAFLSDIKAKVTGDVHLFDYSYPGGIYAMGVALSAGESLSWLRRSLFNEYNFDDMNALAGASPPGSNKLIFLPYIFGERCPYSDANARGVFFGLSGTTDRRDIVRAVMEGVAYSMKDLYGLVSDFVPIDEIYITGGGAKSNVWGQIISDVIGVELSVLNIEEGPAFGAAIIAAVGCGMYGSFEEAKAKTLSVTKVFRPQPKSVYEKQYAIYKKLYAANKNLFAELSAAE